MIEPIYDRIVVKRLEPKQQTDGGIILPDVAKTQEHQGEIVATGPGAMREDGSLIPMSVKVGDEIMFSKHAGMKITYQGGEYWVMNEEDILGIVPK